jgi:hypothetical protein
LSSALDFDYGGDDEDEELSEGLAHHRRVLTRNLDEPIDSVVSRIIKGRLILQPEFQRQYVWPKGKASRLIESILLGIPLPSFYMAEIPGGKWEAVDGCRFRTDRAIHSDLMPPPVPI